MDELVSADHALENALDWLEKAEGELSDAEQESEGQWATPIQAGKKVREAILLLQAARAILEPEVTAEFHMRMREEREGGY